MKIKKTLPVIVPTLLFIMLAVCIKAGITVNFEGWAYRESVEKMSPAFTAIMRGITHLGEPVLIIIFCLLLFLFAKPRKTIALPLSIAVILSGVLNIVIKILYKRERPDILRLVNETSYSFPSGHAMVNASLYTMVILLAFRYMKSRPRKIVLSAVCITLTIAIGFSRVYLGVHYAGDVLGGWLIGFALSLFVYFMWDYYLTKKENTGGK